MSDIPLARLIDTGLPVTLIGASIWGKIAVRSDIKLDPWERLYFVGANGAPLDVKVCYRVSDEAKWLFWG